MFLCNLKLKFYFVFTQAREHKGFDSNDRAQVNGRWDNSLAFVKMSVHFLTVCLLLVNMFELLDF